MVPLLIRYIESVMLASIAFLAREFGLMIARQLGRTRLSSSDADKAGARRFALAVGARAVGEVGSLALIALSGHPGIWAFTLLATRLAFVSTNDTIIDDKGRARVLSWSLRSRVIPFDAAVSSAAFLTALPGLLPAVGGTPGLAVAALGVAGATAFLSFTLFFAYQTLILKKVM